MPANANNVTEKFAVTAAPWNGAYKYSQKWSQRWTHNPWVWIHESNANAPHLTTWENDFDQGGQLVSFHITYPYRGAHHKPVHVYFTIANGVVRWKSVDGNRCGGDKDAAVRDAKTAAAKAEHVALAEQLVAGAFPD